MTIDKTPRSDARRKRFRRTLARSKPPCHWCGTELSFKPADVHQPHAFQIDHVVPLYRGGADTLDNLVPSCRACNRKRGVGPDPEQTARQLVTFVTERTWKP